MLRALRDAIDDVLAGFSPFQRRAEDRLQAVDRHQDRIGKAATHRTPLIAEFVVLAEAAVNTISLCAITAAPAQSLTRAAPL